MSAEQKEKEIIEITGNSFVQIESVKAITEEMVFTIRNGALVMQLNKESAVLICRTLADRLGFEITPKEILRIFKDKANIKSSRAFPLGA